MPGLNPIPHMLLKTGFTLLRLETHLGFRSSCLSTKGLLKAKKLRRRGFLGANAELPSHTCLTKCNQSTCVMLTPSTPLWVYMLYYPVSQCRSPCRSEALLWGVYCGFKPRRVSVCCVTAALASLLKHTVFMGLKRAIKRLVKSCVIN